MLPPPQYGTKRPHSGSGAFLSVSGPALPPSNATLYKLLI